MGGLEASTSQRFASNYEPQRMTPRFYFSTIVLSILWQDTLRYVGSFLKSPLLISTNVGQTVRPVISLTLEQLSPDCKFVSRNPEKSRNIGGRSINGPNLKRRARISPFRWCQHESCGEFETHSIIAAGRRLFVVVRAYPGFDAPGARAEEKLL